jgi:hypothetical protein
VLFSEVEHDGPLLGDESHMNPDEGVEHPPAGGVLSGFALLVRKRRPMVLECLADAIFQGRIHEQTYCHHHQERHDGFCRKFSSAVIYGMISLRGRWWLERVMHFHEFFNELNKLYS